MHNTEQNIAHDEKNQPMDWLLWSPQTNSFISFYIKMTGYTALIKAH